MIGCIYRSPNSEESWNNEFSISEARLKVEQNEYQALVVCGHFNIPKIEWSEEVTRRVISKN